MKIERTEESTGGNLRTKREEIAPLFDGKGEVEPEQYLDCSPSEGWPWDSDPTITTWRLQLASVKGYLVPFGQLDSQAGHEAGGGGIATYPFSDRYLPLSDQEDDEGEIIIDVNGTNFDQRLRYFMELHSQFFENGIPTRGGTVIMSAIDAGDEHFMDEFGDRARDARPTRLRAVWTDGLLRDAKRFQDYLRQAQAATSQVSNVTKVGRHGEWDEVWAIAIFGDEGGDGHKAYLQYVELAKDHPWIHPYYFEGVKNPDEISEDMAIASVPTAA
jgi:hypothetical protein